MKTEDKVIVSEHILEVRHSPSGRFLDVRGYVADHIKGSDLFPHWEINTNVVNFRDAPTKAKTIGAFAGFKSAGFFAYDPVSRNFFEDKAGQYWKALVKNQFYTLPEIKRFGCRTKTFLNSDKSFSEINDILYDQFFTDSFKKLIGEKEKDLQIVIDLIVQDFKVKIICGPIHKKEAGKYFAFESEHFNESGVYLDIDVSKAEPVQQTDIPKLIKDAMKLTWNRIDQISSGIGI